MSELRELIAQWRGLALSIGPYLEGAAFEQCANQLEAALSSLPGGQPVEELKGGDALDLEQRPDRRTRTVTESGAQVVTGGSHPVEQHAGSESASDVGAHGQPESHQTVPATAGQNETVRPQDTYRWGEPMPQFAVLGIGPEAWADLVIAEKQAHASRTTDRSGVSVKWGTFRAVMNVLRAIRLEDFEAPSSGAVRQQELQTGDTHVDNLSQPDQQATGGKNEAVRP